MDARKRKRTSPAPGRSPAAVRAKLMQNLRQRCTTFATSQRGPTCYMAAATLVFGRTLLKRAPQPDIRHYVLRAQAQAWDDALGPEERDTCPRIPESVRRYYERIYFYVEQYMKGTPFHALIEHRDVYRTKRPNALVLGDGGVPDFFLSALLWAAFQKEHAHRSVPPVAVPKEGDAVRVTRPRDHRLHQIGRIVDVDLLQQGAFVQFDDGPVEALGFLSFTIDGVAYPIPAPPHAEELPRTCKTLLVHVPFRPPLALLFLRKALAGIEPLALRSGFRVIAMIVNVQNGQDRRHAIAAFPCVAFPLGWMFCNSWAKGSDARCQTFGDLQLDLYSRQFLDVISVNVLYERV
jgi:hypothetical protein